MVFLKRYKYFIIFFVILVLGSIAGTYYLKTDKFISNSYVLGTDISGLNKDEAINKLKLNYPSQEIALFNYQNQSFVLPLSELKFEYDYENTINAAYKRQTGLLDKFELIIGKTKNNQDLLFEIDEEKLDEHLSIIIAQVVEPPIYPQLNLVGGDVVVKNGSVGTDLNKEELISNIKIALKKYNTSEFLLTTVDVDPRLNDEEIEQIVDKANNLIKKDINLIIDKQTYKIDEEALLGFLNYDSTTNEVTVKSEIGEISNFFDRDVQNPVFKYSGDIVEEFIPAKNGVEIDQEKLFDELLEIVNGTEYKYQIELAYDTIDPDFETEEVNNLGIDTLIGKGESEFRGSISSRIHNVNHASEKFNGILIAPGEIFSFNEILGDVSEYTGFKQAYIIKDGRTVLGDGGGVCQVSTTLFRAALDAGLPIVERRAHSYRVSYYEQNADPGFDATVYAPTTDLKIQNDTSAYILIQTIIDTKLKTLDFEIYGTDDGRKVTITEPVVYELTEPPEDLYVDDPEKPEGYMEQIDWKAWGAKSYFNYSVEKEGEITYSKKFYSNYRPWQSIFIRGTAPI